jgi:hypothetical protein
LWGLGGGGRGCGARSRGVHLGPTGGFALCAGGGVGLGLDLTFGGTLGPALRTRCQLQLGKYAGDDTSVFVRWDRLGSLRWSLGRLVGGRSAVGPEVIRCDNELGWRR